jgi:hypothetical protein
MNSLREGFIGTPAMIEKKISLGSFPSRSPSLYLCSLCKVRTVILLFIVTSVIISHLPFISNLAKAILATFGFYLFPLIVGWVIVEIALEILRIHSLNIMLQLILSYFIGLLALFVSFTATVNLQFWSVSLFTLFWIVLVASYILFDIVKPGFGSNVRLPNRSDTLNVIALMLIASISGGLLPTIVESSNLPFPSVYDPGTPLYILQSLQLSNGESIENFVTLQRLPIIMLVGIVSRIYSVNPIFINFVVSKTFYFILAAIVFLLARKVVRSNGIALVSAIIAPWVVNMPLSTDLTPPGLLVVIFPYAFLGLLYVTEIRSVTGLRMHYLLVLLAFGVLYPIVTLLQALLAPTFLIAKIFLFLTIALIFLGIFLVREEGIRILILVYSTITVSMTYLMIENSIFYALFLSFYLLIQIFWTKRNKLSRIIGLIFSFCVCLFILIQVYGLLVPPNNFLISKLFWGSIYDNSWFNMNAHQKLVWLGTCASSYIFVLIIWLSLPLAIMDSRNRIGPIAIVCALNFLILFFPEGHFWRAYNMLYLTGGLLIPYFFWRLLSVFRVQFDPEIIEFLQKIKHALSAHVFKVHFQNINIKMTSVVKPFIILITISLLLIPTTFVNKKNFILSIIEDVNKHGTFSYLTLDEMFLAMSLSEGTPKNWVKYDYLTGLPVSVPYDNLTLHNPKLTYVKYVPLTNDTMLISDPFTMLVLGGLTGRDTALIERAFIYTHEYSIEALERMNFIKNNVFLAKTPLEAYENILKIKGSHTEVLVIVTERTVAWINSNDQFIASAQPLAQSIFQTYLSVFNDKNLFTPIYCVNNTVVYKVNILNSNVGTTKPVPILASLVENDPANSTGLIGWWKLNEGEGSVIKDSSGNGHTGVINKGSWLFDDYLNRSYLVFNGENESADLGTFNVTSFTIEAWIYLNSIGNEYVSILSKSSAYLHAVALQVIPDGRLEIGYVSPNLLNNYLYSASKVPLKKWTYIAATYEPGKGFEIYINGYLDSSGVTSGNISLSPLKTNMNWSLGRVLQRYGFNGSIAMLRIYDRALSSDEIFHNSGASALLLNSTQLHVHVRDIMGLGVPNALVTAYIKDQLPVISRTNGSGWASLQIISSQQVNKITIEGLLESLSINLSTQPQADVVQVTIITSPFFVEIVLIIVCLCAFLLLLRKFKKYQEPSTPID